MATILNKLPREMRDQIYRELLVDDVYGIGIVHDCHHQFTKRKQLSPAILRVCKQVFFEASIILYEENTFYFTDAIYCGRPGHENESIDCTHVILFPPHEKTIGTFDRIKHLNLTYYGDTPRLSQPPYPMRFTLGVMKVIAKTGCSLKTLRLSLELRSCKYNLHDLDAGSFMVPGDKGILHAIADLKVQQKIEITVNSDDAGYYRVCEDITNKIGSLLQWATNTTKKYIKYSMKEGRTLSEETHTYEEEENLVEGSQKNSKAETSSDSDTDDASVDSEDSDIAGDILCNYYIWKWTLAPTATAVGDKGIETAAKSLT